MPLENVYAEKGPYKHFMAKEMHEQPTVIADALARYLTPDRKAAAAPGRHRLRRAATGWCSSPAARRTTPATWRSTGSRASPACRSRSRSPPSSATASRRSAPGTLGIFVSQSGETADTLAALRYVRGQGGRIVSVVNVETSTIARESDVALPILAGPEIGVASTKAFTCQLTVLAALALAAGRQRGHLDAAEEERLAAALGSVPGLVARALALEPRDRRDRPRPRRAPATCSSSAAAPMYPLALEGALKLKEISYIHAEGYASGELKHGPIALIDEDVPVIVLAPSDAALRQDRLEHAGGDGPRRQGAAAQRRRRPRPGRRRRLARARRCRPADPFVAPIVYAAPAQLLAYHTAVLKGTDVDQPRNLAKSVTVE